MTGYGGWSWISKTRVPRFLPKLPGNTNVNYRRELEGEPRPRVPSWEGLLHSLTLISFPTGPAARRGQENGAACTGSPESETVSENPRSPRSPSAACEGSEENCKPAAVKTEGDVAMEEEECGGEGQAEGESPPEPAVIHQDRGQHQWWPATVDK